MTAVIALLWLCALIGAALVLVLIYELTTPVDADLESLRRHEADRAAFRQARTTSTTPALRAASAEEWRGGGHVPTDEPGAAQPPGRIAPGPTPSRLGGGVGPLVP